MWLKCWHTGHYSSMDTCTGGRGSEAAPEASASRCQAAADINEVVRLLARDAILAPVSLALSMPGSRRYSTSESFPHQRVDVHSYALLAANPPGRR